jgi:hypothetical protein
MDDHRVNESELSAWANLVEAFYDRNGRDPVGPEYDTMLATARQMASDGTAVLH